MNRKIFVISGLGADHTVFANLNLQGVEFVHISWVKTRKGESMADYAKRLLPQIDEINPTVLGLSLGGMLAIEVGKLIPTRMIISLSSITTYKELPWYFKLAGWLGCFKFFPFHWFSKGNWITQWFFGVKTKNDREILNAVFRQLDNDFLYWALSAIYNWENKVLPPNIVRIHGTNDHVLPINKDALYTIIVENGSHLMLLDKSEEVSHHLLQIIEA